MLKDYCGGGSSTSVTVTASGNKLITGDKRINYIRLSNMGDGYVFVSPGNSATNIAELNKGIVLAPKGVPGWTLELNTTSMFQCDFWAICEASNIVSVFIGR